MVTNLPLWKLEIGLPPVGMPEHSPAAGAAGGGIGRHRCDRPLYALRDLSSERRFGGLSGGSGTRAEPRPQSHLGLGLVRRPPHLQRSTVASVGGLEQRDAHQPHDPMMWNFMLWVMCAHYCAGEDEAALHSAERLIRFRPNKTVTYPYRAAALGQLGRTEAAKTALQEAIALSAKKHLRVLPRPMGATAGSGAFGRRSAQSRIG